MGKKTNFGLLAVAAAAGAVAVAAKYLKDYTDFKTDAARDFHDLEDNTEEVKDAAKRTYISIKEHSDASDVKAAAGEFARATADAAKDAGILAKKAGHTTVEAVKEIKERYNEDPEGTREGLIDSLRGISADAARKISRVTAAAADKLQPETPFEEVAEKVSDAAEDAADNVLEAAASVKETAEDIAEEGKEAVKEAAENAGSAVKETAENIKDAAEEAAEEAQQTAADLKEEVGSNVKDTAQQAKELAEQTAAKAAAAEENVRAAAGRTVDEVREKIEKASE